MNEPIPLSIPEIRDTEWQYVKECLDTGWVSSVGPFVSRFENMMAENVEAQYAVATVTGTAALHVALRVAGVGLDDEVIVPALTFIAPANAVRYCGAVPVFADVDPYCWQLDVQQVGDFLDHRCHWERGELLNRETGRRVKALLPVHILGHPCDMDPLLAMKDKYGLALIEDASESLGAKYRSRPVGNLGDIGCFSFNGNKLITTGGGGMIVTDREDWAERARYLTTQAKDDGVEYIHGETGYNYRLTNLQAAVGCAQLERLAEYVTAKRAIAERYTKELYEIPGITPIVTTSYAFCTYWLFTVLFDEAVFGMDSRTVLRKLALEQIQTRPVWQPLSQSPAFADLAPSSCPVAESIYQRALSLPCSVGLSSEQQSRVITTLRRLQERSNRI